MRMKLLISMESEVAAAAAVNKASRIDVEKSFRRSNKGWQFNDHRHSHTLAYYYYYLKHFPLFSIISIQNAQKMASIGFDDAFC